jgi:hypothetical protein
MPRPSAPIRRRLGRLAAVAAVGVSALTLSGCIAINSTSSSQPQSMGPLKLTVNACANGAPGCNGPSNSGSIYGFLIGPPALDDNFGAQYLVGMRLPNGSEPSQSFQASHGGGTLAFTRSPSYEAELQALEPAPAGERWWGWISAQTIYSLSAPQSFSATVEATLPPPPGDGPLTSPLRWRPVVGTRWVDGPAMLPANRPVNCGNTNEQLYEGFGENGGSNTSIHCVDSPSPDATRGFLGAPFVDFGVTGTSAEATPDSTLSVPFFAVRSGLADPDTTFALAATSGIPGGTVSLDRTTVSLGGDSSQPVLARVTIPAGTPAGVYPVAVTATAPGKPTRTGTSNVTVKASPTPPTPPPPGSGQLRILSAKLAPKAFRAGAKVAKPRRKPPVGTKLTVDVTHAAQLTLTVERKQPGRRPKGKGCSAKATTGKKCVLWPKAGTVSHRLPAGKSTVDFPGKIGRKLLAKGGYRMQLSVKAGASSAKLAKPLGFTVLKQR